MAKVWNSSGVLLGFDASRAWLEGFWGSYPCIVNNFTHAEILNI